MSAPANSYRQIVSNIFRLTMAVADGQRMHAADLFDNILHQLEQEHRTNENLVSVAQDSLNNAFLARDLMRDILEEDIHNPPTLRIHPEAPSAVPDSYVDHVALSKAADVKVTKTTAPVKDEHTVKLSYINNVVPEVHIAKVIGVEEEVRFDPIHVNKKHTTTPATEEVVEEEEVEGEAEEEVQEEEVEGEAEEAEEKVEAEAEEPEEEVEVEEEGEAEDEVEEEVEVEEEEAEEEEGMEVIKIGKKKYFCGEHSKQVYVFISDEEAGECLGRLENGKIVPL